MHTTLSVVDISDTTFNRKLYDNWLVSSKIQAVAGLVFKG